MIKVSVNKLFFMCMVLCSTQLYGASSSESKTDHGGGGCHLTSAPPSQPHTPQRSTPKGITPVTPETPEFPNARGARGHVGHFLSEERMRQLLYGEETAPVAPSSSLVGEGASSTTSNTTMTSGVSLSKNHEQEVFFAEALTAALLSQSSLQKQQGGDAATAMTGGTMGTTTASGDQQCQVNGDQSKTARGMSSMGLSPTTEVIYPCHLADAEPRLGVKKGLSSRGTQSFTLPPSSPSEEKLFFDSSLRGSPLHSNRSSRGSPKSPAEAHQASSETFVKSSLTSNLSSRLHTLLKAAITLPMHQDDVSATSQAVVGRVVTDSKS